MSLAGFIPIIIFVALVIGMTWLAHRVAKVEYKIEEKYIIMKFYYWGLLPTKFRIKLDSIIEVKMINSKQFFSMLLKSKPWPMYWGKFTRMLVMIKRRGFFGTIFISPPDPVAFIEELRIKSAQPILGK